MQNKSISYDDGLTAHQGHTLCSDVQWSIHYNYQTRRNVLAEDAIYMTFHKIIIVLFCFDQYFEKTIFNYDHFK